MKFVHLLVPGPHPLDLAGPAQVYPPRPVRAADLAAGAGGRVHRCADAAPVADAFMRTFGV